MPKLDFGNRKGELDVFSGGRLLAIMTHPKNKIHRDEYLAWLIVDQIYLGTKKKWENAEMLWHNHDFIKCGGAERLINAPSYEDVMARAYTSQREGIVAGEIVLHIINFYNDPKAPTMGVNGAVKIMDHVLQRIHKKQGRMKYRKIYSCWEEFKEVAHLWYAYTTKYKAKLEKICIQENIPPLLALSEEIRKFGETYKWNPHRPSLFQKGKTWTPPKDFPLPIAKIKTNKVKGWHSALIKKK